MNTSSVEDVDIPVFVPTTSSNNYEYKVITEDDTPLNTNNYNTLLGDEPISLVISQSYEDAQDRILQTKKSEQLDFNEEEEIHLKNGRIRKRVVEEIVASEKKYFNGLHQLINIFMDPLSSKIQQYGRLMNTIEHSTIFPSDIRTIYNFHLSLLSELMKASVTWNNDSSIIGSIFIKYSPLFKMYQNYMNNHEKASSLLIKLQTENNKLSIWLGKQQSLVNGQTLQSLLILPIQRVPRYQLLLKELIKRTEIYDNLHPDLYNLKNAYEQICEVNERMNERMKEFERHQRVAEIENRFGRNIVREKLGGESLVTPSRYYIYDSECNDGCIIKHDKHGNTLVIALYLFNDCLIYGYFPDKNNKNNGNQVTLCASTERVPTKRLSYLSLLTTMIVKENIKFGHILLFDSLFYVQDMEQYKNLLCLKIYARTYSMLVSFSSLEWKLKWIEMITDTCIKLSKLRTKDESCAINLAYPLFIPDDYSEKCMVCDTKFTLINRRHHCYYCGQLACGRCTDYRLENAWKKNEIVRVCGQCYNEHKDYTEKLPINIASEARNRGSVWTIYQSDYSADDSDGDTSHVNVDYKNTNRLPSPSPQSMTFGDDDSAAPSNIQIVLNFQKKSSRQSNRRLLMRRMSGRKDAELKVLNDEKEEEADDENDDVFVEVKEQIVIEEKKNSDGENLDNLLEFNGMFIEQTSTYLRIEPSLIVLTSEEEINIDENKEDYVLSQMPINDMKDNVVYDSLTVEDNEGIEAVVTADCIRKLSFMEDDEIPNDLFENVNSFVFSFYVYGWMSDGFIDV